MLEVNSLLKVGEREKESERKGKSKGERGEKRIWRRRKREMLKHLLMSHPTANMILIPSVSTFAIPGIYTSISKEVISVVDTLEQLF